MPRAAPSALRRKLAMTPTYLLKRLASIAVTLWVVSLLVFVITQTLPGNAAQMILGEFATAEALRALEIQLGLDRPWWEQYWRWFTGALAWDWGTSLKTAQPVGASVALALERSLILAALSLAAVIAVAIPLGILAALRRGRASDVGVSVFSYLGVSVPEFVTATLILVWLARPELGWFPAGGYEPLSAGAWTWLKHHVLPVLCLAIIMTAHISRQTRSELVDTLQMDFVRTATLKGLSRARVVLRHALPNAMLPTITVIALDIGYLIGGILVVEEVFAFPGLGRLLIFALQNRDLPMIQAATLALAAVYAFANLAADLVYAWLDRRIQYA